VLINAVLNVIPIFYLSFLKMPASIIKKVVRIQREFLWGGVRGGNKISWVKWSVVCKEKSKGGLDVRDIKLVNLSLLSKWRWRLLQTEAPLWKRVLVAKYGSHITTQVEWSNFRIPSCSSKWWKDICALEGVIESKNWLLESVVRRIGDGGTTSFWLTCWLGDVPLSELFPRLFSLSIHKNDMIDNFYERIGVGVNWYFSWRRPLFQWESVLVLDLIVFLYGTGIS
jgi:hypothetical protein